MPKQPFFPARLRSNSPAVIEPAPPEPVMAMEISHVWVEFMTRDYPRKPSPFHDGCQKKGRRFSLAAFPTE
jgi:hypothetical protein